ncbi:hypothetical protein GOP47_0025908 [Adiantum capillus-veneris]|uniref:DNA topoisomerase (ATP-hydrolyzing) n=1 Tax=Adiantum capillus-veneris TaxID=13818 RepID=A0A9D4Z3B6_ADICA|nr:hypothetical protein GOP47_0025908 [Adiantum capillus-veneris]
MPERHGFATLRRLFILGHSWTNQPKLSTKVAQFSGYVSEHSAYHHGEQSLVSTIIGMAQNYVGSNINLLSPLGQFGTRSQGGKDHANGRYIFTCLSPITCYIFPKGDDILLEYLKEDGQQIEPTWYCPILPMVLVNGSEGIGTGWSTFVPNYNPRDIVANIHRLLNDEPMESMDPWYKGFQGTIEHTVTKESGRSYTISGVYELVDETTLRITELPVRKWTQDYKEFLESMMNPTDKIKEPFIKDYREHNTDTREVQLSENNMAVALAEGMPKKFKLTTTISTSNMHLFDARGHIRKFESPEEILEAFFSIRLELYVKRKEVQLQNLESELLKLNNKVRFVLGVVKGQIIVNNRKRAELLLELKLKRLHTLPQEIQDWDKLEGDVEELKRATPKSLWLKDLDEFLVKLNAQELEEAKEEYEVKLPSKKAAPAKPSTLVNVDSDDEDLGVSLRERLAVYSKSVNVPPLEKTDEEQRASVEDEGQVMSEDEMPKPRKKGAGGRPRKVIVDSDNDSGSAADDNSDRDMEDKPKKGKKAVVPAAKKGGAAAGRKTKVAPVASKAVAASKLEEVEGGAAVGKKRGNTTKAKGQKLMEEIIAQESSPVHKSPAQKVRRMRPSPFHKKSGSITAKLAAEEQHQKDDGEKEVEEVSAGPAVARPKRTNRAVVQYVISDDDEEEVSGGGDDFSDFEAEESE